jgi:Predicted amidohydrolase
MWNTGYALDRLDVLADENGEKTIGMLATLARKYHVHIVGG